MGNSPRAILTIGQKCKNYVHTGTMRSLLRRLFNRALHLLARNLPGASSLRPFLHRLRGVKISGRVFIGDDVYLENEYPEAVELCDGALIGLRSTIVAHTRGPGRIVIGEKAVIGAGTLISCSAGKTVIVGAGSVISVGSVVTNSIPRFTLCSGPRVKSIALVTVPFTLETSHEAFLRGLRPIRKGRTTEGSVDVGDQSKPVPASGIARDR